MSEQTQSRTCDHCAYWVGHHTSARISACNDRRCSSKAEALQTAYNYSCSSFCPLEFLDKFWSADIERFANEQQADYKQQ